MPLVSVIVPVYKVEQVVKNCIESILNQTFTDFELILVDDGSPDNSGRICDEYAKKDDRVIVIHKENGGVSSARNVGIDKAKGKYICFVDSDDYAEMSYLQELVEQMNDEVKFAFCCYYKVTESGKRNKVIIPNKTDYFLIDKNNIFSINDYVVMSQPWNKIFLREIICDNNLKMDESLSIGEDMLFVFEYLSKIIDGKFAVVNKPLYDYSSFGEESLLLKYRDNLLDSTVYFNYKMEELVLKLNLPKKEIDSFYNSCFFFFFYVLRNTLKSNLNITKKIKINNKIMKKKDFRYFLEKFNGNMNGLYKKCYKKGNYLLIYILEKIH